MTNEELLKNISTLFVTEMTGFREEVNAAIYASEKRMEARFDRVEARLDRVEERLTHLELDMISVKDRLSTLEGRFIVLEKRFDVQEERISKLETRVEAITDILNDFSYAINDLKVSLVALENKVDDNHRVAMREIQRLNQTILKLNENLEKRITRHENLPFDQAHPRPHSAA